MGELARPIDVVFDLQVPDRQQLFDRLMKRAREENRSDDTPEAMERRLELYDRETAPLVEYYRSTRGNVVGIHADRSIEDVFSEVQRSLSAVEARA
jgi:adenylate kinase